MTILIIITHELVFLLLLSTRLTVRILFIINTVSISFLSDGVTLCRSLSFVHTFLAFYLASRTCGFEELVKYGPGSTSLEVESGELNVCARERCSSAHRHGEHDRTR